MSRVEESSFHLAVWKPVARREGHGSRDHRFFSLLGGRKLFAQSKQSAFEIWQRYPARSSRPTSALSCMSAWLLDLHRARPMRVRAGCLALNMHDHSLRVTWSDALLSTPPEFTRVIFGVKNRYPRQSSHATRRIAANGTNTQSYTAFLPRVQWHPRAPSGELAGQRARSPFGARSLVSLAARARC